MLDLNQLIKESMKKKDTVALTTYRSLKSKIMVILTSSKRDHDKPLTSEEEASAIKREIKERKEANEFLKKGDVTFDENVLIISILDQHLPKQLTIEDTDAIIEKAFLTLNPQGMKDMGKVMGFVKKENLPIDMKYVSDKIKEKLGS